MMGTNYWLPACDGRNPAGLLRSCLLWAVVAVVMWLLLGPEGWLKWSRGLRCDERVCILCLSVYFADNSLLSASISKSKIAIGLENGKF